MANRPDITPEMQAARDKLFRDLGEGLPGASKQTTNLSSASLSQATLRLKTILGKNYFGADDYKVIFGVDVDKVPEIPASVTPELLNSKCPMVVDSRLIKDTHRLVLVPRLLGTDEFTIMWLKEHADKYAKDNDMHEAFRTNIDWFHEGKETFACTPTDKTHWALLPMLPVPDTFEKKDAKQLKIMKAYRDYKTPQVIEMLAGIILPYLRDARGVEDYDYPFEYVYGRCEDRDSDGYRVSVGGFGASGVFVSCHWRDSRDSYLGRCSSRKLAAP